jgi:putative Holliday junction resolvase
MSQSKAVLALDVGEKRIGVAAADGTVLIARTLGTVEVDGDELSAILRFLSHERAEVVVIGYPRNQSGEATAQTAFVEAFAERLRQVTDTPLVFQDESLTSVIAEQRLQSYGKPYAKGDIDALAAALILQDYLEQRDGRI